MKFFTFLLLLLLIPSFVFADWAITPHGVGNPVGARSIKPEWPLAEGETFKVGIDQWDKNKVLAEDGISLRDGTADELSEPSTYSSADFFDRFTKQERKAIRQASKNNDDLEEFVQRLMMTPIVDVSSQNTIDGMAALVAAGLITQERSDEILQ